MKIPYRYSWREPDKAFMLSDINDGIILCKKLGFTPRTITIGQKEFESMKHWTYSGAPLDYDATKVFFGFPIRKINRKSHLSFNCVET